MPTYEYRCKGCGRNLEVVQAFTDNALTTCEDCGGDLRKVFGSVGISFKGSGFYKTDSRSSSSSAKAGASSSDKGSSDTGTSDKGSSDKGSSDKASTSSDSGSSATSSTASTPASTPS